MAQVRTSARMTPARLRRWLNLYPPFLGAGIRVVEISDDWTRARVRLSLHRLNRNYVGTAFGGSLSAMADPFYMLLASHQLGRDHVVWDRAGEIEYVAPGRGTVHGTFEMPPTVVAELRAAAADGSKVLRWFEADLVDDDGAVVARVRRQLYVRRRRDASSAGTSTTTR